MTLKAYVFIDVLFKDAVSNWGCVASNDDNDVERA
jgi:hypothetical protein